MRFEAVCKERQYQDEIIISRVCETCAHLNTDDGCTLVSYCMTERPRGWQEQVSNLGYFQLSNTCNWWHHCIRVKPASLQAKSLGCLPWKSINRSMQRCSADNPANALGRALELPRKRGWKRLVTYTSTSRAFLTDLIASWSCSNRPQHQCSAIMREFFCGW